MPTARAVRWSLFVIVLVSVQFFFLRHFWAGQVGDFLIRQDAIAPADAILVLGGGSGERTQQGVALYQQDYAPLLIISAENNHSLYSRTFQWGKAARDLAIAGGVPDDRILLIETSTSTRDDALLSKELCLSRGLRSLIIVSEPFHTRRAWWTFKKEYRGSDIRLMMYPVQQSWYTRDGWWHSEEGFLSTVNEYVKIVYYLFKGYLF